MTHELKATITCEESNEGMLDRTCMPPRSVPLPNGSRNKQDLLWLLARVFSILS